MAVPAPFYVQICSICGKRVNAESRKTDEEGRAIHEECSLSQENGKKNEGRSFPRTDFDQYES